MGRLRAGGADAAGRWDVHLRSAPGRQPFRRPLRRLRSEGRPRRLTTPGPKATRACVLREGIPEITGGPRGDVPPPGARVASSGAAFAAPRSRIPSRSGIGADASPCCRDPAVPVVRGPAVRRRGHPGAGTTEGRHPRRLAAEMKRERAPAVHRNPLPLRPGAILGRSRPAHRDFRPLAAADAGGAAPAPEPPPGSPARPGGSPRGRRCRSPWSGAASSRPYLLRQRAAWASTKGEASASPNLAGTPPGSPGVQATGIAQDPLRGPPREGTSGCRRGGPLGGGRLLPFPRDTSPCPQGVVHFSVRPGRPAATIPERK